jgi:hypothetical protein
MQAALIIAEWRRLGESGNHRITVIFFRIDGILFIRNWLVRHGKEFVIGDLLMVICNFFWNRLRGRQFEWERRMLCPKPLQTGFNVGWCLLR